jgi:hypothetical protein
MTISLSNAILERMGYQPLSTPESIAARFHYLHVYEIRGFTVDEASLQAQSGTVVRRPYQLGVGSSVNAVCRTLIGDDLSENELEWQKEHKCSPPYLIVHLGPTDVHTFAGTHARVDEPTIQTYDGFPFARAELHAWGEEVLPSLLAGLASSFSLHDKLVRFVPTDRAFYGITNDGRTVLDSRLLVSASAYGSTRLSADQASERLASAMGIASRMKQKVARFFHLAIHEEDPLKRFLYFFLAIEIETHATFAAIDHPRQISSLVLPPTHAVVTTQTFFEGQRQKWTNLRDRFVWCVLCAWPHLSDSDVEDFKRLKTIRDEIAHGSLATPPSDSVLIVEKLAAKLQLPAS